MKRNARGFGALSLGALAGMGLLAAVSSALETEDCQECHGDLSIVEKGGGYLYVDSAQYARTAHAQVGCPACHESVTEEHPDDKVRPSRAGCGDCHEEVAREYAASVHGGNAACTDCHNPHEVKSVEAVSGFDMNRRCMACHEEEGVRRSHATWLVQAELHIASLPCVTCHTGSENYVITFYIEKLDEGGGPGSRVNLATFEDIATWVRGRKTQRLVDTDGNGAISLVELQTFHRNATKLGYRLWGMMTPAEASHSYDILDNRWDCTFCHASGPGAAQTSYVAFPDERGAYSRVPVEKGAILDALYGTPDFYMVGATRNDTLSAVGLVIVGAGLLMPLGHGLLRLLTVKNRREG